MKFIRTQRNQLLFNKTIENMDLQGISSEKIILWVRNHRARFGIREKDMQYMIKYFLG